MRSLFGVVGLLRGDRLCGESVDILGDRLCGESRDILGDRFVIEIRCDRCLMLLVC